MAEGLNVRLTGRLQKFVKLKSDPEQGLFSSASEYIRDLIRHDYEQEESRKWHALEQELSAGLAAEESEFLISDASSIIAEAKRRRAEANDT